MKMAWFSPLPPLESAVSQYSKWVLGCLKNHCEVHLWVDGFAPEWEASGEFTIIDYRNNPDVLPLLNTYDVIVYNMADNADFHGGIYEVMRLYPGVVILHDYVLHRFQAAYWIGQQNDPEGYFGEVRRRYGPAVEDKTRRSLCLGGIPFWETEEVLHCPLNEDVLEKAVGVVVHSEDSQNKIPAHLKEKIRIIDKSFDTVQDEPPTGNGNDLGLLEDRDNLVAMRSLDTVKNRYTDSPSDRFCLELLSFILELPVPHQDRLYFRLLDKVTDVICEIDQNVIPFPLRVAKELRWLGPNEWLPNNSSNSLPMSRGGF